MPHWVQVNFPAAAEVARVEVTSREGGYLITDVEIQVPEGKDWKTVASVRGGKTRTLAAAPAEPVKTAKVRFKILKEQIGGKPRPIADVGTVRIFDTAGRNLATDQQMRVALLPKTDAAKVAFAGVTVAPQAVRVRLRGAELLAEFDSRGAYAAVLHHQAGKGKAFLVTPSATAVGPDPRFWTGMAGLLGVKPTLACSDPARYRVILNRIQVGHVLHAIDRRANSAPAEVTLTLDPASLGAPKSATLVPTNAAVPLKPADGKLTLTVKPDPVASVVLK